jgi:hypothetical protein
MFPKRELSRRGASTQVVQRIGRKQRGARSGSAGYRQEDFFAVSQMIAAAHRYLTHGDDFWMIQNAAALVDDVVTGNGTHCFYQLKTSPKVTWAPLCADFRGQAHLCNLFGMTKYKLVLVVPSEVDQIRLARAKPRDIKRAHVLWFPKMSRTVDLANPNSPVLPHLKALCAGRPGGGDLASIAAYAFMTVLDRPARPRQYAISAFLRKLRENESVPIRTPFVDKSARWKRALAVLARIPHLKTSVSDGFLVFDYRNGLETGRAAKCGTIAYRRFLERVIALSPKTFDDFERLL